MAKILAVDDSNSLRRMVSLTLTRDGHDVIEASDGAQGLEHARDGRIDLALVDVNMPVMDGITLTRELRALNGYRFTPILILTTESSPARKAEGKEAGATGWLVKPFSPEQLLTVVHQVLG